MDTRLSRHEISRSFGHSPLVAFAKAEKPHRLAIVPKNPTQAPSIAQVESERKMWGPHPDPNHSWIEEQFYGRGAAFLRATLYRVLGQKKELAKAEGGWGDVAKLFGGDMTPEKKMSTWETLIDEFTTKILPAETIESVSAAWALRSGLLSLLGNHVHAIRETPGDWNAFHKLLPPHRKESIEWQKENGARLMVGLKEKTRAKIKEVLVQSEIGNLPRGRMEQKLIEDFGSLNRDWRRVVLTETASAVSSGALSQVAGLEGWEGVWTGTMNACPFCMKMYGRSFKIVSADAPKKDGQKEIWPGKNNLGRSASLYRRDGTKRKPEELWWACIPAHPCCCCSWQIRKVINSKNASPLQAKIRASLDREVADRRKRDKEFFKYVSSKSALSPK